MSIACRLLLPGVLLLGAGCNFGDAVYASDHRALFWSGRVNVDPRSSERRTASEGRAVTWRPGIEIEVSGVSDVPRTNTFEVNDYSYVLGTLSWSPEIWIHDWLGVIGQAGMGAHESQFHSSRMGTSTRFTYERSEAGVGLFTALGLAVKPWPWLQAYGRVGAYLAGDFANSTREVGVKVGLPDSVWIFAAWRDAEIVQREDLWWIQNRTRVEIDTDGLLIGAELRF